MTTPLIDATNALVALSGTKAFTAVHDAYVDFFDDLTVAYIWENILGWLSFSGEEVLVRTDQEWSSRFKIKRRALESAQRTLVEAGFCEVWNAPVEGTPWPITHYRVNVEVFVEKFAAWATQKRGEAAQQGGGSESGGNPTAPKTTSLPKNIVPRNGVQCTNQQGTLYKTPTLNIGLKPTDSPIGESVSVPVVLAIGNQPVSVPRNDHEFALPELTAEQLNSITESIKGDGPSKRKRSSKSPTAAHRTPSPTYEMAQEIAAVCRLDFAVDSNRGKCLVAAKQILNATIPATPELLRQKFGMGGWWYGKDVSDFRAYSRDKQTALPPTPSIIMERWGQWGVGVVAAASSSEYQPPEAMNGYSRDQVLAMQRQGLRSA